MVRIAKTKLVMLKGEVIPALSLRYRIEPPRTVALLHIEISLPDEMEIDDG
jgi:hypothetical protein